MAKRRAGPVVTRKELADRREVIVELRPTRAMVAAATSGPYANRPRYGLPRAFNLSELLPGIDLDPTFRPTTVPAADNPLLTGGKRQFAARGAAEVGKGFNFIVRAEVDRSQVEELAARPGVIGVFADLVIEPYARRKHPKHIPSNCSREALGTDADVERLLCVPKMKSRGLDGSYVFVAVVDTGINVDYLRDHGKYPSFDRRRSWLPSSAKSKIPGIDLVLGKMPVGHGTMCAFDACIAAPECTLLDIALFARDALAETAFLSDALQAYEHLLDVMMNLARPGEPTSLVVSNSWGTYDTSSDLPVGDPGNYSDNLNHPFNRSVAALDAAGADILFAAGNCGTPCPALACLGVTTNTISGANSHPGVLTVAGVDVSRTRVGYSSIGPGRLTSEKPDICGYTQFAGSEVEPVDEGTSAACPVVAGVVAAFRTRWAYDPEAADTHPAAIRSFLTSNARDLGLVGFDFQHGHGVVQGCPLADMFILAVVDSPSIVSVKFDPPGDRIPAGGRPGRGQPERQASTLPPELVKILIQRAREASLDDIDQDDALVRDMSAILEVLSCGKPRNAADSPRATSAGLWLQGLRGRMSSCER